MSKVFIRQTQSRSKNNNSSDSLNRTFYKSITVNPEEQVKSAYQSDSLLRIVNFDNGNPVKDCKAYLDTLKQDFSQQKEKLLLFYQDQYNQLLDDIDVKNISLDKIFNEKQTKQSNDRTKKHIKKPFNEVFHNYSKLMNYSLRQHDRIKFMNQAYKRSNSQQLNINPITVNKSNNLLKRSKIISSNSQSDTILDTMMNQKRNKIAIQNSSKINADEKDLEIIMKNRSTCEKILEEALMFERYFDVLKKQKLKLLQSKNKSHSSFKTEPSRNNQQKKIRYGKSTVRSLKNPNTIIKFNLRKNDLCVDPKQLRLPTSQFEIGGKSQTDFKRQKYMTKLKRDEYLKQINRINEEFVQKKNMKNNILINKLLKFIRNNSLNGNQETISKQVKEDCSADQNPMKTTIKKQEVQRSLSGPALTKILRKIFLIYSHSQIQAIGSQFDSLIVKENVCAFLEDFQIDIDRFSSKNQKIKEFLQKDALDQFQFIQLIHLLSASYYSSAYDDSDDFESLIYTNIGNWISGKILDKQYEKFLSIQEERILVQNIPKTVEKIIKINRLSDKIATLIDMFVKQEKINQLMVPTLFEDFDYVLEILWFMKIYPVYVNKKTIRFYFQYLKQASENVIGQKNSKKSNRNIIQNIVLFVIAKISKDQQKTGCLENKSQLDLTKENQFKSLQEAFVAKFKIILKQFNAILGSCSSQRDQSST